MTTTFSSASSSNATTYTPRFRYLDLPISTKICNWGKSIADKDPTPSSALSCMICAIALPIILMIGAIEISVNVILNPILWIANQIHRYAESNKKPTTAPTLLSPRETTPPAVQSKSWTETAKNVAISLAKLPFKLLG